jgi:2-haloalkanoic acid dehalogenase type II
MAITGRWPRAVFYDSKTTLFNWAWSWREAATRILARHGSKVAPQDFLETWVRMFEGLHRRASFFRYTQVTDLVREALDYAGRLHGVSCKPGDVETYLELQQKVELFPDTEEALTKQQALGVKIIIYSDVESKVLRMYVDKFKRFKPDFVGTTEDAGVAKPNPRTYEWVLRKTGLERRDVIYCAAPMFDIQGAMSAGMIAAWLRRPEGRLSKETHTAGDLQADFEIESLHELTQILERNRRPQG